MVLMFAGSVSVQQPMEHSVWLLLMLCLCMWRLWAVLSVSGGKLFINWLLNSLFLKEHGTLLLTEKLLFCLLIVLVLQPYTGSSLLILLKSINSRLITSISKVTELCWEAGLLFLSALFLKWLYTHCGREKHLDTRIRCLTFKRRNIFRVLVCWTSREGGKQVKSVKS